VVLNRLLNSSDCGSQIDIFNNVLVHFTSCNLAHDPVVGLIIYIMETPGTYADMYQCTSMTTHVTVDLNLRPLIICGRISKSNPD